jgi:hypothetical protein
MNPLLLRYFLTVNDTELRQLLALSIMPLLLVSTEQKESKPAGSAPVTQLPLLSHVVGWVH